MGDNVLFYYDKPDHPKTGEAYLNKKKPLVLTDFTTINIDELFKNLEIKDEERWLVIGIVSLHWDFGNVLRAWTDETKPPPESAVVEYLKHIVTYIHSQRIKFNSIEEIIIFIKIIILVSVCDIKGSQVYIGDNISNNPLLKDNPNSNASLEYNYNYITNYPKTRRGGNKFEEFKIDTKGYKLYEYILDYFRNKISKDIFIDQGILNDKDTKEFKDIEEKYKARIHSILHEKRKWIGFDAVKV
jgi:hypothetical protein